MYIVTSSTSVFIFFILFPVSYAKKKDAPLDRDHPLLQILPPQMRPLRIRTLSVSCFFGHDNQVRNGA